MFIYTENGTESYRKTQNINIYSPNTPKILNYFQMFQLFQNFQKIQLKQKEFYDYLYGIIYIV